MHTKTKTIICLFCLLFSVVKFYSQEENEPFSYKFKGHIPMFKLNLSKNDFETIKVGNDQKRKVYFGYDLLFNKIGVFYENTDTGQKVKYYKVSPLRYKYSIEVPSSDYTNYGVSSSDVATGFKVFRVKNKDLKDNLSDKRNTTILKKSDNDVSYGDHDNVYLIPSTEFDEYETEGDIYKKYRLGHLDFDYGAQLSVPFKLRPKINDDNMRITPEFQLGGFMSLKTRIDRKRGRFLHLPLITAGVSGLGVNSDNKIDESTTTGEGLVMGTTFTVGSAIELGDFQIGLMMGWDKAGGEVGKDWQYNGRPWYSFGIGFSFLQRSKSKEEQKKKEKNDS
ncbi:hypothetical protein [uncultured Maribacter sp.]|uniref:hypothetical protein n=1 Tax=uncultured Maribacter sp. TaxID=431308 RepID=UPI00262CCAF9|nr:hypothetical protein [uncultured Maribacter sp.]